MAGAVSTSGTPGGPRPAGAEEARSWRCSEHSDRPVELFCRRCRRCVCALCPVLGAHRGHPVALAWEEAARVQKLIQECLEHLTIKKQQHIGNVTHIEGAAEKLKSLFSRKGHVHGNKAIKQLHKQIMKSLHGPKSLMQKPVNWPTNHTFSEDHAESSKAWLKEKFTVLRLLLDEEEVLAKKFIDKNMQLVLQAYREQVESCKRQVNIIDDFASRVWDIGQEPNPIQLLQAYTATELEMQRHMSLGELSHPMPLSFEPVKSFFKDFTEAMQRTVQTPLDIRLKENLKCQLSSSSSARPGTLLKTSPSPERSLLLKYTRTPTLDPDTMHARLRLSADRLTVRRGLVGSLGPTPALRFDALWQVLSRDCFAAGRHYWEVDLQEAGCGWWVGAAYPSLRRHGDSTAARLGCNRQSWCLKRYDLEYWAFHDCQRSRLRPQDDPDRLGVFLDYEAGILAFYDVTGGMRHLHTFHATFQEPLYPALRLWEGAISIPRLP